MSVEPPFPSRPLMKGYRKLDGGKLLRAIEALARDIERVFPDSGLAGVAHELEDVCRLSQQRIRWISRPIWWLRIPRYFIAACLVVLLGYSFFHLFAVESEALSVANLIQTLESQIQIFVYGGAVGLFVWGLERRIKRSRALSEIHELRSIIHVIDMHQLSKDPDWVAEDGIEELGGGSARTLPDLLRYLDACSDLLALAGKVAALYLREMDDPSVVAAVQEVEELATGFSRKIWQKITILVGLRNQAQA